jgi:hypothetical protein
MAIDPRTDFEKFKHCGEMTDALRKFMDESVSNDPNECEICKEKLNDNGKCDSAICQKGHD